MSTFDEVRAGKADANVVGATHRGGRAIGWWTFVVGLLAAGAWLPLRQYYVERQQSVMDGRFVFQLHPIPTGMLCVPFVAVTFLVLSAAFSLPGARRRVALVLSVALFMLGAADWYVFKVVLR